ncbi:MAG: type II toxin-antitoxin system HigB family toxin [Dehalococcoidia bacterium]|nr:type II toxin-antitoxin system HigB family toxin [Dehalococcoidia bacterium]
MRIISRRALREFWNRHPEAEQPLKAWYSEVKQADWSTPSHVARRYPRASIVGGDRVVFRIRHNDFRIVARVFYPGRIVYVRFVGTHEEYDRVNVEEV